MRRSESKQWSLNVRQRLSIVLCAWLYLVAFRPWNTGDASLYAGPAAMLALAALPKGTRLAVAIGVAVIVALLVLFVSRAG